MKSDNIGTIFAICFAYFAGTFIFGYMPSLIKASPSLMNLFTIFASGTIIAASVGIVLP